MALDYGNYGIFLIMGYAGYISSTVGHPWQPKLNFHKTRKPDPNLWAQNPPS